jgi:hypothetical protein
MHQERITERNKKNKGQHSTEDKRKMMRDENAFTTSMKLRWKSDA